ncbi:septal ring lytic transglycosylase RlpA family protein, partial [Idiomarina baltica]|uniref:septal ring lytic transglycosylase RlpA family protein n=1 Tax=Idiomarina baltica TaxID=190892 RepID=UPI002FDDA425
QPAKIIAARPATVIVAQYYSHFDDTAAHKTLPFGTLVRVTNLASGESVVVKINDRGPFIKGRIIDLSRSAFGEIADLDVGIIDVKMQVITD